MNLDRLVGFLARIALVVALVLAVILLLGHLDARLPDELL